jgi:purine-nucleoside phosphorylase
MRSLGVKNFILTNAAGSMIEESSPGDLMLIRDHINFTAHNPLTMRELPNGIIGRFHDMSSVYDADLALGLESQLKYSNFRTHHGVYLGLVGPTFETPAEIKSFAKIGADAVGMSTVLEAIYLKASGARVCGLSLLSNMACGFQSKINERTENSTPKELSATEVFETAERIAPKLAKSLINFITQERTFL